MLRSLRFRFSFSVFKDLGSVSIYLLFNFSDWIPAGAEMVFFFLGSFLFSVCLVFLLEEGFSCFPLLFLFLFFFSSLESSLPLLVMISLIGGVLALDA